MDGHLLLVSVLYKGFTYWPIGNALHPQTLRTIALAFSWVLASASLLALPTTFIMLIVQGCFGLLNRIAPPLNLFSLGFPINMLVGLVCFATPALQPAGSLSASGEFCPATTRRAERSLWRIAAAKKKTEKPSAQKLRKAREEGQLPRSKDMGLAASLFAAFVVISSSFPWYADFVRESFISVHQYAQEINNPDAIGQFLRHHLLILGKFILTLLPMPAAALLSLTGARRLAVSAEKNPPGFQQNQSVKRD